MKLVVASVYKHYAPLEEKGGTSEQLNLWRKVKNSQIVFFFLLRAAKVRSSFEEGPGQSALQSAYHNPQLDVNELITKE